MAFWRGIGIMIEGIEKGLEEVLTTPGELWDGAKGLARARFTGDYSLNIPGRPGLAPMMMEFHLDGPTQSYSITLLHFEGTGDVWHLLDDDDKRYVHKLLNEEIKLIMKKT